MSAMMSPEHLFFAQTLERYERPLVRYALSIVGQLEDAQDIVQDVFLKFSQSMHSLDQEHLAPWLFTVCRNRATDHLRKFKRVTLMENETLDREVSQTAAPGDNLDSEETAAVLQQLLTRLPEKQREAIRMKFIAGLSYKEISDAMKTSVGNVGYLIHHGVQALKQEWLTYQEPLTPKH
jgi:RNA polymerase sigma factor (sigma-70 family)